VRKVKVDAAEYRQADIACFFNVINKTNAAYYIRLQVINDHIATHIDIIFDAALNTSGGAFCV
jgi:hypothetical protein